MDYDIGLVKRRRIISPDECYFAVPGSLGQRSLVLTAASSQYLSRTWGLAETDNTRFTISLWIKRLTDQAARANFHDGGNYNATSASTPFQFTATDVLQYTEWNGSSTVAANTAPVTETYTDTTIWHNFHLLVDTNQVGGAGTQMRLFADGVESAYGGFSVAYGAGANSHPADNGITSYIGAEGGTANFLNAKVAYFYMIDGQALLPSSFVTGTGAGTTHPISYAGTFGNNGFLLDFRNSNTNDQSGRGNHWTQNNGPTFSTDLPT